MVLDSRGPWRDRHLFILSAELMTSTENPLLQPWTAPYGLPPFAAIHPEHFVPAFEEALAAHRAEIAAPSASKEPPSFENTLAALRPKRTCALPDRKDVLQSHELRDVSGSAGGRARNVAASCRPPQRDLPRFIAVRADRRTASASQRARSGRGAAAAARARAFRFRARRRAPIRTGQGTARRDRRAPRQPVDAIRPERARGRSELPVGAEGRAGPRGSARGSARRRARSRHAARRRDRRGDHAVTLADRSVSHVLGAARPARGSLQGVDPPRRERRRARQPAGRARDPGAAQRAREAAWLSQLRRLRAGRPDGGHAGRGRATAGTGLGAGEGPRRDRVRRAPRDRAGAWRNAPDRAVGLAVLRREGPQGALRLR